MLLGLCWWAGASLLVEASRSSVEANRAHNAPVCTADQLFTDTYCYDTLDGTMIGLDHYQADVDVGKRHLTAPVAFVGPVEDVRGLPVRVTVYRGKVVHIEGSRLKFDAQDAPAAIFEGYLDLGLTVAVGGGGLVVISLLLRLRRKPPTQDSGSA